MECAPKCIIIIELIMAQQGNVLCILNTCCSFMQQAESLIEELRTNRKLSKSEARIDSWEHSIETHLKAAKKNIRTRRDIVNHSVEFHEKAKTVRTG